MIQHQDYPKPEAHPDDYHVTLEFWNEAVSLPSDYRDKAIGYVYAKKLSDKKSQVAVKPSRPSDWPTLEPIWNCFLKFLAEKKWLKSIKPLRRSNPPEWVFNGTPYDFANLTVDFSRKLWDENPELVYYVFYDPGDTPAKTTSAIKNHDQSLRSSKPVKRESTGMRGSTAERVKVFHQCMKNGDKVSRAIKKSHCDPRTYQRHCKIVTGDEPIDPTTT